MATQRDVAELAKVSFITVSRVVNKVGNVKESTRKKVEKAIKTLNYYPNTIAQGLNSNKIKTIAIQTPLPIDVSIEATSYYRRILIGIEQCCIARGYDLLISTQRGQSKAIDYLKPYYQRKADGLIIIAAKPSDSEISSTIRDKIPCVLIGDRHEGSQLSFIDTNNREGMVQACQFLISKGHRNIGYIIGNVMNTNAQDRIAGYRSTIQKHGLEINQDWIFQGEYTKKSGSEALKYFASLKNKPSAIISSTDLMAIGFFEEAKRSGIRIPEDFSLLGFDGHEICSYTNPAITTVYQPLEIMGQEGSGVLIDTIEKTITGTKQVIFPVSLQIGGSVKAIH